MTSSRLGTKLIIRDKVGREKKTIRILQKFYGISD